MRADLEERGPSQHEDTQPPFDSCVVAWLAVLVAVVAITAVLLVATHDVPGSSESADAPLVRPRLSAELDVAFPAEPGPFGQAWRWMATRGQVTTKGAKGQHYLAFRALSVKGSRKLYVGSASPVRLDESPRSYIVGPLETGSGRLVLRASPGARRISRQDRRRVSTFLANARLTAEPVAALPGKGFYQEEQLPNGATFQWLRNRGVVDVVTKGTAPRSASIALTLRSPIRRRITARVDGGSSVGPVTLRAGMLVRVTVPVPLNAGRGRFRVLVDPGPRRIGDKNPRSLSAALLRITAAAEPRSGP